MTKEQTDDTGRDLLRQFISDENKSFAQETQGSFWPNNHHRLGGSMPFRVGRDALPDGRRGAERVIGKVLQA